MSDALAVGLFQLGCRANGNPYDRAVVDELRRLYHALGEPLPMPLAIPEPCADYPPEQPEIFYRSTP